MKYGARNRITAKVKSIKTSLQTIADNVTAGTHDVVLQLKSPQLRK